MLLVSAAVGPFKSIDTVQTVSIDPDVTVLVGMNEAGKTVFLHALERSNDVLDLVKFDPVEDYPRKDLPTYLRKHPTSPAAATKLTYQLTGDESVQLSKKLGTPVPANFTFTVTHTYANARTISLSIDEGPVVAALIKSARLSSDASTALKGVKKFGGIPNALKDLSLTEPDQQFLNGINGRLAKTAASNWGTSVVSFEAWEWVSPRIPKFWYFGEYDLLPSKMNLAQLAQLVAQVPSNPAVLTADHRGVLALLRMADIAVEDFTGFGGYEQMKAKIEGVSISLTDQIMEFWKQNEDLEVEVDIKPDPHDQPPYNNGPNLYLRIKNKRHRGVSTPFRQRSRGFIWFFSFLVWFDSVQNQLATTKNSADLILLLDEPGLSLHAMAQADFLRYIDSLAEKHQVIYTTHSPFMVHSDRLNQVRVVEDKPKVGTVISDNIGSSDPRTVFPLQAALGWTIAQNLFISERNLLVEGPSELVYLQIASGLLDSEGKGLRQDVTIVPVGGLDKVVTFIALLNASGLKLAVLHDYRGAPEQKIMDLVRQKMISDKAVLNASQFRDLAKLGASGRPADIEDLFPVAQYLDYLNTAFKKQLPKALKETDLPSGDRIVDRLERYLEKEGVAIRPSGGFNHYLVAAEFAKNPPAKMDADTKARFTALFTAVNALFG